MDEFNYDNRTDDLSWMLLHRSGVDIDGNAIFGSIGDAMDGGRLAAYFTIARICAFKEASSEQQGSVCEFDGGIDRYGFYCGCKWATQVEVATTEGGASEGGGTEEPDTERAKRGARVSGGAGGAERGDICGSAGLLE